MYIINKWLSFVSCCALVYPHCRLLLLSITLLIHVKGYLLPARLLFPVKTNPLTRVLPSHSADSAPLQFFSLPPDSVPHPSSPHTKAALDTQNCHDGRQINTCMLKPIWARGLCRWQSAGDGSETGKYEVCVLTGGEMTKAKMMSGCYYCWHSTKMFPPSRHFTALSCRQQQQPPCTTAQTLFIQKAFNPAGNSSG